MALHGLTWQEKHTHVLAYLDQGYGGKSEYLREHGISQQQIRTWRTQVYVGTLERGLIPREWVVNNESENREISRLARHNEELRELLSEQADLHHEAMATKDAELAHQKAAVEALGKAIALLHPSSDSAADTTGGSPRPKSKS
jgi:transposase-like protein